MEAQEAQQAPPAPVCVHRYRLPEVDGSPTVVGHCVYCGKATQPLKSGSDSWHGDWAAESIVPRDR